MKKQVVLVGLVIVSSHYLCAMKKTLGPCSRATVIVKPWEYDIVSVSFLGGDGSSEIFGPSEVVENPILNCFDIKHQRFFGQKKLLEFIALAHYARTKELKKGVGVYDCVVPEKTSFSSVCLGYVRTCEWALKKRREFSEVRIRLLPRELDESGAPLYK